MATTATTSSRSPSTRLRARSCGLTRTSGDGEADDRGPDQQAHDVAGGVRVGRPPGQQQSQPGPGQRDGQRHDLHDQDTPVLMLVDETERVVLSVDGARLVQVPDEVRRLLGPSAPEVDGPVWWVEVRASSTHQGAAAAARWLARELIERHGGAIWPQEPR